MENIKKQIEAHSKVLSEAISGWKAIAMNRQGLELEEKRAQHFPACVAVEMNGSQGGGRGWSGARKTRICRTQCVCCLGIKIPRKTGLSEGEKKMRKKKANWKE